MIRRRPHDPEQSTARMQSAIWDRRVARMREDRARGDRVWAIHSALALLSLSLRRSCPAVMSVSRAR